MTIEEKRIKLAEACGWTNIDHYLDRAPIPFTRSHLSGTNDGLPEGEDTLGHEIKLLPDYFTSLDAVHGAILSQPEDVQWATFTELAHIVPAERPAYLGSAADWANALGRALGLWQD